MSDLDPRLVGVVQSALEKRLGLAPEGIAKWVADAVWAWLEEGDEDVTYTCCTGLVGGDHHPDCEVAGIFAGPLPY